MKTTTVKAPYFSQTIGAIFIFLFITSCGVNKTLNHETVYQGYSVEGSHARGLAVIESQAIVGGADGYVSLNFFDSTDQSFNKKAKVPGVDDFRDVHYTELGDCFFMNSGDRGSIFSIAASGSRGNPFDTAGVFLDGFDFWDAQSGIVYGDPIDGAFFLARTDDAGKSWQALTPNTLPVALENEGGFAASGTGIQTLGDSTVYFATGLGAVARLYCSSDRGENWVAKDTPMKSGDSYGIYSMYFWAKDKGVIIGGSYKDSTFNEGICQYTESAGNKWEDRSKGLPGYCSCVHGTADGNLLVATGRSGTFYSLDQGKKWNLLTNRPFYTCHVSETRIVLSGRNGTLEFIEYSIQEN